MMTTPFLKVVERREVGVELTTVRSGRRHSVPVGMDEEMGRNSVERRRRCGLLLGSGCTFYRGRRGAPRRWGEMVEWPE
jgi:hypothetical protein